ncbi:hypothetical protein [Dechloromonas denitrificans]|uniref:hypothetical protein n=1 Tax=Dechloromonas denitrificans TaxID=281362 RepID=UPI0039AFA4C3
MVQRRLARQLHGEVELDLCFSCQGIWFDDFESAQLTPGSIIELFRLIHQHRDDQRLPLRDSLHCPRCDERLLHSMDIVRSGHFNYHRCLQKHGRFTSFAQFMIEKGFVRQLTVAEVDQLKARIGSVRCTGCGAPVDIKRDYACTHCRSPIAILDPEAVEQALATYQQAEIKRTTRDPAMLADAILGTEKERARRQREKSNLVDSADIGDLIISGIEVAWKIFH